MTEQVIAAVYDTPAHAELAVEDLLEAGIPDGAIHRHAREGSYPGRASAPVSRGNEQGGFWSSLFGGEPDHDTDVYDRTVASGASAVTVKVPDEQVSTVMRILESHAPIDIDERASSLGLSRDVTATTPPAAAQTRTGVGEADGTLQLSEETLDVGKRVVNRGTTRIRRFVVETPVEQQVSLRDERVTIERRPVTDGRVVSAADFADKTIEVTETAEEAVVSKVARVKEEIALRKESFDRTETVHDTLRREDVEIEKVPGADVTADRARRSGV